MKVLVIILLVLIICSYIFYMSSTVHRIGYVILVVLGMYLVVMSGSAFNNTSYNFMSYCFLAVFIYSVIGIVEAVARIFIIDFTFGDFITKKIISSKEKKTIEKQGKLSEQLDIENKRENNYRKIETGKSINVSENIQNNILASSEYNSFVYNDYIDLFIKRKKFFDSDMEKKFYPIIRAFIDVNYPVFAHVSLRDIFYWGKWEDNWMLTNRVNGMHFDFVVFGYLLDELIPILFIEVQGEKHYTDPKTIERDQFKEKLLEKCSLKLITIDASKTIPDDEISKTVMQHIKNEVPSRDDYNVYCPLCKAPMKIKQRNNDQGYFYGCSKWKFDGTGCSGTKSISEVPPLYNGIPIKQGILT